MKAYLLKLLTLVLFTIVLTLGNSYAANAPWVGETFSNAPCRGAIGGYGPFDYTMRASLPKHNLYIVEIAHFTSSVEALVKGKSGSLIADISYTLRAWPNHHRALNSLNRYKLLFPKGRKVTPPVECYFQRAINFSPEDATTRMLYGIYLHKTKHFKMATKEYEKAVKLSPSNPVTRYNYGLLLVNLKKYDLAQEQAIIAYDAGFPLNGLKNKLKAVKHWLPKAKPVAPVSEEKEKTN